MSLTSIRLIWFRELRDQLRDRRTIFSIAILPLVLYPLMGMVFLQVAQFLQEHPTTVCLIGARELSTEPALLEGGSFAAEFCPPEESVLLDVTLCSVRLEEGETYAERASAAIRGGPYDAVVVFPPGFSERLSAFRDHVRSHADGGGVAAADLAARIPSPEIFVNLADDKSRMARDRLERVVQRWREGIVRETLRDRQFPIEALEPFRVGATDVSEESLRRAAVWSKLLPFVVLIWALTGAFYPAIDLCAGEKERGTLETLLCSPALRSEIVWGKLLTVTTFSTVTALLNLFSLALTGILLFGRLSGMGQMGARVELGPPPLWAFFWLLLTIVPIAALFSGLALAVASFARSSKEGQYYLMPLMLIMLPLMTLPMLPAVELNLGFSVLPVAGVMLWLRALIEGEYLSAARYALPVIGVTAACCWLAIRWAERQFQSEEVLFRESERCGPQLWLRHLMRDRQDTPTAALGFGCGLLILMLTFFASVPAAVPRDWSAMAGRVVFMQIALIAAPAVLSALLLTRRPRRSLLLQTAPRGSGLAAVALALALHPWVLVLGTSIRRIYPLGEETLRALEPLVAALSQAPFWQVLLVVAVVPAVCEELAFRGLILTGLRRLGSNTAAILISSLFFGLTHGMLQQSLAAMLVGMLIGLIAVQTGSLWPCILFHATHNGLALGAARLGEYVRSQGGWQWLTYHTFGPLGDELHYRWPVLLASLMLSLLLIVWFRTMPRLDRGHCETVSGCRG